MSDSGHGWPRPMLPQTISPRTPGTAPRSATASASRWSSSSRQRPPGSMPSWSGPGDQAELGGGDQADVAGDDPDGVAEGAGGGQGDLALERPAVGGALADLLEGGQLDLGELVGVVDPPVGDLDLDLARVEVAQLHKGPDREPGPQQALPDAVLDPAYGHPRPGRGRPALPGRQLPGGGEVVAGQAPRGRGRGQVVALGVVAHHPAGQDGRPQRDQVVLDHGDPAPGQAVRPVVEQRQDLVLEQVVDGRRLELVAALGLDGGVVGRGDRPAVLAVVQLVPPAVADRQVEAAVEGRLHAAGPTGLVRPQGVVEPDVGPGDQGPGHGHVVVGQERDPVPDLGLGGEAGEVGDQRLAPLVGRVGLAGDQQLDGPLLVQQQPGQPLLVLEQQGQPLVGGDPAGEPDGQHLGVEGPVDPAQLALAGPSGQPGPLQPGADVVDQPFAGDPAQLPDLLVRGAGQRLPGPGRDPEVGADAVLEQPGELAVDPGAGVDPVGDVADRHLGLLEPGPQAAEHLPRHLAVQAADPVGPLGQAQAHDGHVEHGVVAVGLGPELHDLLDPEAGVDPVVAEVALDEG